MWLEVKERFIAALARQRTHCHLWFAPSRLFINFTTAFHSVSSLWSCLLLLNALQILLPHNLAFQSIVLLLLHSQIYSIVY